MRSHLLSFLSFFVIDIPTPYQMELASIESRRYEVTG